jgi:hypothetical protein
MLIANITTRYEEYLEKLFPLSCVITGSGPTQSPVQWVPGVLSPGLKRGRGLTLTTHPI